MAREKDLSQQEIELFFKSALNMARLENKIDQFWDEFKELRDAIVNNLGFREYLSNPSIPTDAKIKAIFKILGEDSTKAIKAVTIMIITMEEVGKIYDFFVGLTKKLKIQQEAEVVSAIKLDSDFINKIKKIVDEKTGLDVSIRNIVNEDILGGIVIRIADKIIDLSIKGKMDALRSRLKSIEIKG